MGKEGPGVQSCRATSTTTPASEMATPMTFLKFFNILCAPSVRLDGAPMEATAGLAIPMAGIEKLQARVKSPTSPGRISAPLPASDGRSRTNWLARSHARATAALEFPHAEFGDACIAAVCGLADVVRAGPAVGQFDEKMWLCSAHDGANPRATTDAGRANSAQALAFNFFDNNVTPTVEKGSHA
ncbi:hypothetical protein D9M68_784890 [compost metagenome]